MRLALIFIIVSLTTVSTFAANLQASKKCALLKVAAEKLRCDKILKEDGFFTSEEAMCTSLGGAGAEYHANALLTCLEKVARVKPNPYTIEACRRARLNKVTGRAPYLSTNVMLQCFDLLFRYPETPPDVFYRCSDVYKINPLADAELQKVTEKHLVDCFIKGASDYQKNAEAFSTKSGKK